MDNTVYRGEQDAVPGVQHPCTSSHRDAFALERRGLHLDTVCLKKLQETFGVLVASSRPWKLGMLETGCCKESGINLCSSENTCRNRLGEM